MNGIVRSAARLILAVQKAWTRKWSFLVLSLCLFFVSVIILGNLDLLPNPAKPVPSVTLSTSPLVASAAPASSNATTSATEVPMKIAIPSITLVTTVSNPLKTDIQTLDDALLSGAVRYPTSAKLNESGNVVIFGHSSYLPIVHNQAYKTFNAIQNLHEGDAIIVYSSSTTYTYKVRTVSKEDAKSGAIPLTVSGKVLTLATCDSFGTKSDRFVVVADLVESHPISG